MHKNVNEHDRANNELFIIPEITVNTSEPSCHEDESDSTDHSTHVFLYLFI